MLVSAVLQISFNRKCLLEFDTFITTELGTMHRAQLSFKSEILSMRITCTVFQGGNNDVHIKNLKLHGLLEKYFYLLYSLTF